MGNILNCGIKYINKKNVSSLLILEGWSLKYENNKCIYVNKFSKKKQTEYPTSISDYNDIYDFYNIEMLTPIDTIKYLENILMNKEIDLDKHDEDKIYSYIYKIEEENDITEYNLNIINLCVK